MAQPYILRSEGLKTERSARRKVFEKDTSPHVDALWRTALWLTLRGSLAENLILKTMTRAYQEWQDSEDLVNSKARLFRTLTREFFGFGKHKRHCQPSSAFLSENIRTIADPQGRNPQVTTAAIGYSQLPLLADTSQVAVKGAIARLRPRSRLMLILLLRERYSYADIAYITDIRESSVKAILTRLRRLIPLYLAEHAELAAEAAGDAAWSDQSVEFENESETVLVPSSLGWKIQGDGTSQ